MFVTMKPTRGNSSPLCHSTLAITRRARSQLSARYQKSSYRITGNRAVDEWLGLFDDPILGNSALDRLANASYQIVIEGASYCERLSPHGALLERKEVVDSQT